MEKSRFNFAKKTTLILLTILIFLTFFFSFYFAFKDNSPKITLHSSTSETTYNEKQINSFLKKHQVNNNLITYDDSTTTPEEPSGPVYNFGSQTEEEAAIILQAFLQYSLSGNFEQGPLSPGYILNPDESDKWLKSEYINTGDTYLNLADDFAKIKLFNDTSLTDTTMYQYLSDFAKKYPGAINISGFTDLIKSTPKNIWDVINFYDSNSLPVEDLFSALDQTIEYQTEIAKALFAYTYLWQENVSNDFDYYLTQEMYITRPMFIWDVNFNDITNDNQPKEEVTLQNWNAIYNADDSIYTNNGENTDFLKDVSGKDNSYIVNSDDSLRGFEGILNTSSSTLNIVSSFFDFDRYYNYQIDTNEDGTEYVEFQKDDLDQTQFDNLNIYNVNNYPLDDEKVITTADGTVVKIRVDDTTDPENPTPPKSSNNVSTYDLPSQNGQFTGYSYIYYPLFPFIFSQNYHSNDLDNQTANYFYQLKVIDNGDGTYSPYDINKDADSVFLFDIIFDMYQGTLPYSINSIVHYIVYSIYQNNSTSLLSRAYSYWNYKGFYLELSGKYDTKYSSLLPSEIQR